MSNALQDGYVLICSDGVLICAIGPGEGAPMVALPSVVWDAGNLMRAEPRMNLLRTSTNERKIDVRGHRNALGPEGGCIGMYSVSAV